jgi:hypothetical protein
LWNAPFEPEACLNRLPMAVLQQGSQVYSLVVLPDGLLASSSDLRVDSLERGQRDAELRRNAGQDIARTL